MQAELDNITVDERTPTLRRAAWRANPSHRHWTATRR